MPGRWSTFPAVSLLGMLDGMVSCLRTYTPRELREMTAPLEGYTWEIGQERVRGAPARVTYLIGCPAPAAGPVE